MANKIISNLTPKTSPEAADVLAIEDTEATKKIDYNALADAILNKLTSKTYSVAGSTQTLISAIDTLNSNLYNANLGTAINNNDDLDTYTKPGTYYCNSASKAATLAHCPVKNSGFKLLVICTGYENANLIQIIEVPAGLNDGGSTYRRMGNPSAWGNWAKSPTRYDIDTLNNSLGNVSFKSVDLNASSTTSYTISNNSRMVLFLLGADANALCIFLVSATSAGSITRVKIGDGSAITHTVSTNTLTLQNTGTGNMQIRALIFAGDIVRK